MKQKLAQIYDGLVLERPLLTLACLGIVVAFLLYFTPRFKLDASADSLVLENDDDLKYYRSISAKYGSDDFLVITYTPTQALFTPTTLAKLKALQDDLPRPRQRHPCRQHPQCATAQQPAHPAV